MPDTSPRPIVDAQAKAHLSGTADALADLLGREPLRNRRASRSIRRRSRGRLRGISFSTSSSEERAEPEDTQFHASGALTNLTLDRFIGEEKLDQGNFTFDADRNTLNMAGDGQVFGVAAHLDVGRAPGDEGSATVTWTLDQAARAKRGLNFAWLNGPLPIKLTAR